MALRSLPPENLLDALGCLAHPLGSGNVQVIRLSYDLVCICAPTDFQRQLEFAEQLVANDIRMPPQLRLEYAILLMQRGHYIESDRVFKTLRQMWKQNEYFVFVPERLRWLHTIDGRGLQTVQAVSGSDYGYRSMARVSEFDNVAVPYRPEEHGLRDQNPGIRFSCHVSFGHNGPFLRPVTVGPARSD
jgi:hypothetical protein